jgi:hypothetical protein
MEEEYPTHTKKLAKWFEEILKTRVDDVVVKNEEEEIASPSSLLTTTTPNSTCYNYPRIKGVVTIPVEFLFHLQSQISCLLQMNPIQVINNDPSADQSHPESSERI